MPAGDGGLGTALVGEKISVGPMNLSVTKLLGEGGFSYVYLVKDTDGGSSEGQSGPGSEVPSGPLVLKVTSIHSRSQRDIAEKEAKLLSRLSHPSIIKMYHGCYRQTSNQNSGKRGKDPMSAGKERPQHLILMEYCEGGHALDVCSRLAASGQMFDLSALIIAFGQICNAVSYLHAQRPPIVHRDLKPVNFLVKNGAYKLCDFGSAVFGHVDLRTSKARAEAEEVVQKTTTQMFRAPEMVDLYVAKKLTQATDVWALGCCLYSMAFLRNCFEEGSNLAILSRNYSIPEDNPYGDGLVELIDRMLTSDYKARADMTEVILCLSAVYSGRPLPPRKKAKSSKPEEKEQNKKAPEAVKKETSSDTRIGKFRTDAQGIRDDNVFNPSKATEGKKLAKDSVAARRKRAAAASSTAAPSNPTSSTTTDPLTFSSIQSSDDEDDVGFSSFGDMNGFDSTSEDFFNAFDKNKEDQQHFGANDGFDHDAFGSGWGDATAENTDNLQKLSISNFDGDAKNNGRSKPSRRRSDGFGAFEGSDRPKPRRKSSYESTSSLESLGDDGDAHSKPRRKSNTFEGSGERESRSRQRRKSLGGGAGADTEKKERRMKKESGKNEEGGRRRSVSRSRRKPRRGSTSKPGE